MTSETTAAMVRQLRVEHVLGTTVTIDVRAPYVDESVLDAAIAWFHVVDRRFSPYRPDSEVTLVGTGQLALDHASPDVRAMFTLADEVRDRSGGAFDPRGHRPDGRPDPTGVVKGWAVDEAITILRLGGARNAQVAAGGDLVALGEAAPGRPWRIGIRHPDLVQDTAAILALRDLGVATSGLYERGDHIVDGRTGKVPRGLRSMSVVGPRLAVADGYATAAFAMGEEGLAWVAEQPGFGGLAVTDDGRTVWTDMIEELLIAPNPAAG